jgi:CRISPR/Cas system-associated endonuclease/helicase Cas3
MDLTIKLNGDFFENHIPFKYVEYNNVSELKNTFLGDFHQLDITKSKIDSLDKNSEKVRRAAAKYIHEYELIKLICKKVITKHIPIKDNELLDHNEPQPENLLKHWKAVTLYNAIMYDDPYMFYDNYSTVYLYDEFIDLCETVKEYSKDRAITILKTLIQTLRKRKQRAGF